MLRTRRDGGDGKSENRLQERMEMRGCEEREQGGRRKERGREEARNVRAPATACIRVRAHRLCKFEG
jgi:hypothetical protein